MNFWTGLIWIYAMHLTLIGVYFVFKRRLNDARNNRILFLSILLLPLLVWVPIPSVDLVQSQLYLVRLPEFSTQNVGLSGTSIPVSMLYFIPLIALGIHLLFAIIRILKQWKHSSIQKEHGLWVIETEGQNGAKSFFKLVLLPRDMDMLSRALVFAHEKVHADQWHSVDRLIMRIARIFFWVNPLLYFLEREMMLNHEYLADQGVVADQEDKSTYMELMLAEALQVRPDILSHSFSLHHQVKNRINHMYQSQTRSKLYWAWVPVLALTIGFAACNQESTSTEVDQTESTPGATKEETLNAGQVDEMPEMEGGMQALMNFMTNEVKYPEAMKEEGTEAKVLVEFTVKADGSVSDVHALEGRADDAFKEEAVRAVSSMPIWKPGTKKGKAVAVKMVLPINFKLN